MKTYMKYLLVLICLILIIPFFISFNTSVYLMMSNYNKFESIDLLVEIDDEEIYNDTLLYHAFKPFEIEYSMKYGIHKVNVSSSIVGTNQEATIFLFFNQYLLIEYFPKEKKSESNQSFLIETNFHPYYFE